jgi:hypothetical protein
MKGSVFPRQTANKTLVGLVHPQRLDKRMPDFPSKGFINHVALTVISVKLSELPQRILVIPTPGCLSDSPETLTQRISTENCAFAECGQWCVIIAHR